MCAPLTHVCGENSMLMALSIITLPVTFSFFIGVHGKKDKVHRWSRGFALLCEKSIYMSCCKRCSQRWPCGCWWSSSNSLFGTVCETWYAELCRSSEHQRYFRGVLASHMSSAYSVLMWVHFICWGLCLLAFFHCCYVWNWSFICCLFTVCYSFCRSIFVTNL